MQRILFAGIALIFTTQAQAINCTASYEVVENGNLIEKDVEMPEEALLGGEVRYSLEMPEAYFEVQGNPENKFYRVSIVLPPNYTKGVMTSMTWDEVTPLRLTKVDGSIAYKIQCRGN